MARVEPRKRADGGTSVMVRWRLGGRRDGMRQAETFGAGSDEPNTARAEGFKKMVEAAALCPFGGFAGVHLRRMAVTYPM